MARDVFAGSHTLCRRRVHLSVAHGQQHDISSLCHSARRALSERVRPRLAPHSNREVVARNWITVMIFIFNLCYTMSRCPKPSLRSWQKASPPRSRRSILLPTWTTSRSIGTDSSPRWKIYADLNTKDTRSCKKLCRMFSSPSHLQNGLLGFLGIRILGFLGPCRFRMLGLLGTRILSFLGSRILGFFWALPV